MNRKQQYAIAAAAAAGVGYVLWKHHKGSEAEAALGETATNVADEVASEAPEDVEVVPEAEAAVANPTGFFDKLKQIFARSEATVLVPVVFLTFAVLDAIPVPTDIGYFYTEKWLQDNKERLSPREFWTYQYFNYYGWDIGWYVILFLITYYGGANPMDKLKIGLWLISSGAITTMLWRFSTQRPDPKALAA